MWYNSLHFSCSRFLTVRTFLTQVASKSCRSMQLVGLILNLFDAVTDVCNTLWCCQTKENVMKWGYGIDRKVFHLLHGVVVFNICGVVFQCNIISDIRVGNPMVIQFGEKLQLLWSCEPAITDSDSFLAYTCINEWCMHWMHVCTWCCEHKFCVDIFMLHHHV